jgi:ATP-dependent RNA helicase DDX18/HAS1
LVGKNSYLKGEGINAFKSYLHAYTTYNIKEVFNVYALDLKAVGRSFGLVDPPRVDLSNGYGYVDLKIGGSRVRKMKSLVGR